MSDHEVFAFTPTGNVITFKSMASAKAILLREFHHYIVPDAVTLAKRLPDLEVRRLLRKYGIPHDDIDKGTHENRALKLWVVLILVGRTTTEEIKGQPRTKKREPYIYCTYKPEVDHMRDAAYRSLARQARVIVDLAMANIGEEGMPESTFYKLIMDNADQLKTRQSPWRIYKYYEHKLLSRRLLEIG